MSRSTVSLLAMIGSLLAVPASADPTEEDQAARRAAIEAQAKADLKEADAVYAELAAVRITSSVPRELQKQLKRKMELVKKTESAYQAVIKHREPMTTIAAAYGIGLAYLDLHDAMLAVPAPKSLTPEQLELYRAALAEQAAPAKQKAIISFQAAVRKADELGILSKHTELARQRLKELAPPAP